MYFIELCVFTARPQLRQNRSAFEIVETKFITITGRMAKESKPVSQHLLCRQGATVKRCSWPPCGRCSNTQQRLHGQDFKEITLKPAEFNFILKDCLL